MIQMVRQVVLSLKMNLEVDDKPEPTGSIVVLIDKM